MPAEDRHRATRVLYALAVFLSAGLLFVVEPMVGKMAVPMLGGTPAVWTTCLLFFQVALLAGYLYAHLIQAQLALRPQVWLHLGLLAVGLATLPVALPANDLPQSGQSPIGWLLVALLRTVGAPFILLAATAPLLQRWFSRLDHPDASDPYFLYAASNLGSFTGLLAYPFLIEPWLGLSSQRTAWTVGYIALIVAIGVVGLWAVRQSNPEPSKKAATKAAPPAPSEAKAKPWRWLLLAAVPSSLLLGVTTHVSTDIAAVPLLWVLPLALYLLSFVATFARHPWISPRIAQHWLPLLFLQLVAAVMGEASLRTSLALNYGMLFVAGLLCHGQLARLRPPAERLTAFYLWVALGGALGGAFNVLVAPVVFSNVTEYPLAIAATAALATWTPILTGAAGVVTIGLSMVALAVVLGHTAVALEVRRVLPLNLRSLWFLNAAAIAAMFGALLLWRRRFHLMLGLGLPLAVGLHWAVVRRHPGLIYLARDFFGVYRVQYTRGGGFRVLYHGTTIHGLQSRFPPWRRLPTSYYHPEGPLGYIMLGVAPPKPGRRVGVVGLGAGTTAAYAGPGESWTFYEIDPLVERIARDTTLFTFLVDARSPPRIVMGDARISLAHDSTARYDVMILDAFSSDAPPIHLLTREAVGLYFERLAPGGLLAIHLSNRYINFPPVVAALAADAGLVGRVWGQEPPLAQIYRGAFGSTWAVLARREEDLGRITRDPRWERLEAVPGALWTDDYSNIYRRIR